MWTQTTYIDHIIILTRDKLRMSFKSSDIMHVKEYRVHGGEFEGAIKSSIIVRVGDELEPYNVDQDYDKIIKLLYPQPEEDANEAGTDS